MIRVAKAIAGAFVIAFALASPVMAGPAPVAIWITLYYDIPTDGPNLPPKVVTFQFHVRNAEAAKSLCSSPTSLGNVAAFVRSRHVELQGTLDGQSGECVTDKSGQIKMSVDAPANGRN
jgi:hypothetical protein